MKSIRKNNTISRDTLFNCLNKYIDSWNNNQTIESLINILPLLLLLFTSIPFNLKTIKEFETFQSRGFIKGDFLFQFSSEKSQKNDTSSKTILFNECFPIFEECIITLKNHSTYYLFADYYISLSYMLGITDNFYCQELNAAIGQEMMNYFALSGNNYALNFLIESTNLTK